VKKNDWVDLLYDLGVSIVMGALTVMWVANRGGPEWAQTGFGITVTFLYMGLKHR
jgi:hypothetical protein